MKSNIISLSGVQGSGKTAVAEHLRTYIPDAIIYDGKFGFKRYLNNQQEKGTVIIVEYASVILFPDEWLDERSIKRFSKCRLIDRKYFQKGKHFFLDIESEMTQYERLLKRHDGVDNGYIQLMRKEYVHRTQYLRMLADKGYFTKVIIVDEKSIDKIAEEIMDAIT